MRNPAHSALLHLTASAAAVALLLGAQPAEAACPGSPPPHKEWRLEVPVFDPTVGQVIEAPVSTMQFGQVGPNQWPYIDKTCLSGCGPTAHAMMLAFIDARERGRAAQEWRTPASHPDQFWLRPVPIAPFGGGPQVPFTNYVKSEVTLTGLGHTAEVWETFDWLKVMGTLNNEVGTLCGDYTGIQDGAWTDPVQMDDVVDFLKLAEHPFIPLPYSDSHTWIFPGGTHRDAARDFIIHQKHPPVMGIGLWKNGWVLHYVLASGYREPVTASACVFNPQTGQDEWKITATDPDNGEFYMHFGWNGDAAYEGWQRHSVFYAGALHVVDRRQLLTASVKNMNGGIETAIHPTVDLKLAWSSFPDFWVINGGAPSPGTVRAELLIKNGSPANADQIVLESILLSDNLPFGNGQQGWNQVEHVMKPPKAIGYHPNGTKARIRVSGANNTYSLSQEVSIINHPPFPMLFSTPIDAPRGSFGSPAKVAHVADLETPHWFQVIRTNAFGTPISPAEITASGVDVMFSTYSVDSVWAAVAIQAKASCAASQGPVDVYWMVRDPAGQPADTNGTGVYKTTVQVGAPVTVGDYAPVAVPEGRAVTSVLYGTAASSGWVDVPADPTTGEAAWGDVSWECNTAGSCGTIRIRDAGPVGEHTATVNVVDACGQVTQRTLEVSVLEVEDFCEASPSAPVCGTEITATTAVTLQDQSVPGYGGRWYWGSAPADGIVEAFLTIAGTEDVQLALYDETMSFVGGSLGSSKVEFVRAQLPSYSDYYLFVYNAASTPAQIALSISEPTPGPEAAPRIARGTYGSAAFQHLGRPRIDYGDVDYYRIPAGSGIASLKIELSHAHGDIDMVLLDHTGAPVAWSTSMSNQEYIAMPSLYPSTDYVLQVYGWGGATNDYTLFALAGP